MNILAGLEGFAAGFFAVFVLAMFLLLGLVTTGVVWLTLGWRRARVVLTVTVAVGAAPFVILWLASLVASMSERAARREMSGTYTIQDAESRAVLERLGYRSSSGRIVLRADGIFEARDVPDCCVTKTGAALRGGSGKYANFNGSWEHADLTVVPFLHIEVADPLWLAESIHGLVPPAPKERWFAGWGTFDMDVTARPPRALRIAVKNEPLEYVVFSRGVK